MKRIIAVAAGAALAGAIGVAPMALAQDAGHPSHIHVGLCPAPGDVVAGLSNISDEYYIDGKAAAGAAIGAASALPLEAGVTTVPLALADITAADHSIVVHKSAEDLVTYIACGDIGGATLGEADLPVALGELNDSGTGGVAWLHDNRDGSTTVSVFVVDGGAEAGVTAGVALADFSVALAPDTFTVGQPVTFAVANAGPTVHELVLEKAGDIDVPLEINGTAAEVEDIEVGGFGELTYTFTEPGTYQLACHIEGHFEQGMVTTFEVTK